MKRTATLVTLLAGFAGLLVLGLAFRGTGVLPSARAQGQNANSLCPGNCTLATIKGCYAVELSGWVGAGPGRLPYASVGFLSVDGRGGFTGADTVVIDGVATPRTVTGTYTVDPDTCTGTAVSPQAGTFNFVIADSGKETRIISTTPGTTIHGMARRQFGS